MRIAHISDLHICAKNKRTNIRNTKYILNYIINNNFDHVVVTGDVSDNAHSRDFEILRNLFDKAGLLDNDKLTMIIGNHDIFGGVQKPEDIFTFPKKCMQTNYKKMVDDFYTYFIEAFWKTYHPVENEVFPFVKDLGRVILIGLNSVDHYSKIKNPFASNGRISKKQYEGLEKIFAMEEYKNKIRIVCIHHHFYKEPLCNSNPNLSLLERIEKQTMKLRGKKRLLNMFAENDVKLVLHGHLHETCEYDKKNIRFLNAGATINNSIPNLLKIIEIDISEIQTAFTIRELNYSALRLVKETEFTEAIKSIAI
ncbi:MAG: metallophosphoesterase [Ignavibacteriales bacterium]|nr:MAG: metallophosphoesterase [Ignavibacteriales bacterium]